MKKTLLCTLLALIAFAANSVLSRLALSDGAIDAASFTAIRLMSGIVVLLLIVRITKTNKVKKSDLAGSWRAALYLFIYAAAFSFAYLTLETATGALILFGSVQITMVLTELVNGNKLHWIELFGLSAAFAGFVYLVMPSLATPTLTGFMLMSLAGIAWGLYTIAGRGSSNPLVDTAYNFSRTLPFIILLLIVFLDRIVLSEQGIYLAVLSGAIASGLGYVIWYIAVAGLKNTQAAVVQLFVPILAAGGGVLFAQEPITVRLLIASVFVLGGILAVIFARQYAKPI